MHEKRTEKTTDARLELLSEMIADLKEVPVLDELETLIAGGFSPDILLDRCIEGMRRVGKRFEQGRYFIAALIMAGEIMRRATEMLGPHLSTEETGKTRGRLLLGTVQGDIHDLGKNLFASLLHFDGVDVVDLGVDVAPEAFAAAAEEQMPNMVGLSCVLTSCLTGMQDTIELLRGRFGDRRPPVIIGGACVDAKIYEVSGADFWAADVSQGLRMYNQVFDGGFRPSDADPHV